MFILVLIVKHGIPSLCILSPTFTVPFWGHVWVFFFWSKPQNLMFWVPIISNNIKRLGLFFFVGVVGHASKLVVFHN